MNAQVLSNLFFRLQHNKQKVIARVKTHATHKWDHLQNDALQIKLAPKPTLLKVTFSMLLNLGESTLQWTFLDVIISNFFNWSNLVEYNSNTFEKYNKNEMKNEKLYYDPPKSIKYCSKNINVQSKVDFAM